jgi:hypothetical protein
MVERRWYLFWDLSPFIYYSRLSLILTFFIMLKHPQNYKTTVRYMDFLV